MSQITVDKEIKINKLESSKNYEEYSCSGTPVDCVKIATKKILKRKAGFMYFWDKSWFKLLH